MVSPTRHREVRMRVADPDQVHEYKRYRGTSTPYMRYKKPKKMITFTVGLHKQIDDEARSRSWTFSRMVRHLCEASIEGIE